MHVIVDATRSIRRSKHGMGAQDVDITAQMIQQYLLGVGAERTNLNNQLPGQLVSSNIPDHVFKLDQRNRKDDNIKVLEEVVHVKHWKILHINPIGLLAPIHLIDASNPVSAGHLLAQELTKCPVTNNPNVELLRFLSIAG